MSKFNCFLFLEFCKKYLPILEIDRNFALSKYDI